MKGIHFWIEKRAKTNPDRTAVITESDALTYKELSDHIDLVVTFLIDHANVQKGDRIGILSHNCLEYVVLLFAIAKMQCVAVPLNVRLTHHELEYQLKDSGTMLLFVDDEYRDTGYILEKLVGCDVLNIDTLNNLNNVSEYNLDVDDQAPYIICYTSGTTGKPKGAVLTQKNMYINAINNVTAIDISSYDRSIVLLPLFHIGGIGLFAFPTLFAGGSIVIAGKFEPGKVIQMIEKYRVTIVMGVPIMHQSLLLHPLFEKADLSSVRWFYSGGAPCPESLIHRFIEKGFLFGQGFGLTETSPTVFMLSREDAKQKIGSVGKPVLYCDIRIVDDLGQDVCKGKIGNLLVTGNNVMKEYWNNPAATKEAFQDKWFYTGDLVKIDEDGFVYIVGRKKEMIISGGENIYPLEIEKVIQQLTGVIEVAVVGMNDPKWGEIPIAFVVHEQQKKISKEEIIQHCSKFLGKYKVPKQILFVDALPKNSTGKIQKKELTKMVERC